MSALLKDEARYAVKPIDNRLAVVDTKFHDTVICMSASEQLANDICDEYNRKEVDAPSPVTLSTELGRARAEAI